MRSLRNNRVRHLIRFDGPSSWDVYNHDMSTQDSWVTKGGSVVYNSSEDGRSTFKCTAVNGTAGYTRKDMAGGAPATFTTEVVFKATGLLDAADPDAPRARDGGLILISSYDGQYITNVYVLQDMFVGSIGATNYRIEYAATANNTWYVVRVTTNGDDTATVYRKKEDGNWEYIGIANDLQDFASGDGAIYFGAYNDPGDGNVVGWLDSKKIATGIYKARYAT